MDEQIWDTKPNMNFPLKREIKSVLLVQQMIVKIALNVVKAAKLVQMKL